jgi:hypothetical protein
MQVIQITSLTGHSPYDITICDISYSNCSVVATGVVSAPVTVTVPTLLQSATQLILLITDSIGCKYFEVLNCITPTPTPTITTTPTVTPTNISCNCITFVNNTSTDEGYGYTDCDGFNYTYKIGPYSYVYVCGKDPNVFGGPVTYSMGSPCVANTCPFPSPTPTTTPTNTPTITPTNTLTPTITPVYCYSFTSPNPTYYFTDSDVNVNKVYLYGNFTGYTNGYVTDYTGKIIRLNSDLTNDNTFSTGTGFNTVLYDGESIIEQSDGKIIATGSFTSYNGTSANRIIRLNSDGSIDPSFVYGTGFNSFTQGGAIDSNGSIVITGLFSSYNGTSSSRIIRLLSNGLVDPSFVYGSGFNNTTIDVLINPDNGMYILGYFSLYNGTSVSNGITKLLSNGSVDTTFSGGTGFSPFAASNPNNIVRISGETSFYVAGFSTSYNGTLINRIVKLNEFGGIDTSFTGGTGFNDIVYRTDIIWVDKIFLTGNFTDYNGNSCLANCIILNSDGSVLQSFNDSNYTNFFVNNYTVFANSTLTGCIVPVYNYVLPTPTPTTTSTITPTPSITPTITPTPTYPYVFDPYVYLVPEPQDTTSLTDLGSYMFNSGATSFLGWGNGGVPSTGSYSNDLNIYIHYSGFTGGSGNFITDVSTLKGYIRQLTGTGTDSYGCIQHQYSFNSIELLTTQINPNIQYFYTLWIPLNAVGGSMTNMTVDIGYNIPCSTDIVYNAIPDTILAATNVVVSSGAVIPSNVYRVLWIDPTCLIPSSSPPPPLSSSLFFKGNTKT